VVATGSGNVDGADFRGRHRHSTNAGSDGISVTGGGSGNTLIHTFAAVKGDPAIIVNMAGNVDIINGCGLRHGRGHRISGTTTGATTYVNVDVSAAVTGQAGHGIFTSRVGGLNTVNVRQGVP